MQFEEFVAARGPAFLRFAFVLTGDEHTAQDVFQTALADAFRHWRKVSRADSPDAYVRRIVLHSYLATQRRRSAGERPGTSEDGHPVGGDVVPDHADAVVERNSVRRALNDLAPRARAVLVLRYYADLDDASIAELLGLSASGVRATASRALGQLRKQAAPRPAGTGKKTP